MSREIKVGLFVSLALLILIIFIFAVGDLSGYFRPKGYPLYVYFDSAAGLEKKTLVRLAGVKIGRVEDIRLKKSQAEILLLIDKKVQVSRDSVATLAALGLLGEKYIEILPGKSAEYCQPGDTLQGLTPVSLDRIGGQLLSVGEEIRKAGELLQELIGGEETKSSLRQSFENITTFTAELKDFWHQNQKSLEITVNQSSQLTASLTRDLEQLTQSIDETVRLLREVISENRGDIKERLAEMKSLIEEMEKLLREINQSWQKVNEGQGSLGKLLHDPGLYDEAEATVTQSRLIGEKINSIQFRPNFSYHYLGESGQGRGVASFELSLGSPSFLLAQIVRDPWQEKFVYSLQGGRRFGPLAPRVGLIESKFGIGLDYYAWPRRAIFRLEAFDFNRQPRPRWRVWGELWPFSRFYLIMGIEDFTLAPRRELFFGVGVGL
ncbi:MAG: hypothetical protein B5M54_05755 [Candidatus Aminicenantes bacterium 4484_214]|nr:MAG: hypothetical protein B5M54_05755 [Candidatus Aminicenantes bacterium 4484_214]RLE09023.1 MAG: hypothetical protein DRJ06_03630 [Candidatus Aminicenantes bacterium]